MPNPYGVPISLESAKKAAAAAVAEARKNNWTMAVAITDAAGDLVYFEKMDGTQTGSVNVAIGKARSAALFKRPSKVFQDVVAAGGGGLRILGLEGAVPIDGGLPLVMDGKIVGSICHAGLVLISAGILEGHKSTGSEGIKDDLINAGAEWVDEPAFRDGNLVWGRVVEDIPDFCRELVTAIEAG